MAAHRDRAYLAAVAPAALVTVALVVVPLFEALRVTFLPGGSPDFSAVRRALDEPLFLRGLAWNLLIPAVSLLVEGLLGLGMAVAFYLLDLRRGRTFWTAVAVIPFAIPEIVYLLTFKLVLREHGYLNSILHGFGVAAIPWIEPGSALAPLAVALVDAWRVTPMVFLICLAGLEQVPASCIEAAVVEGASTAQLVRHILLPLVFPTFVVAMSLRAVDAFRIFATPLVLTGTDGIPVLTSVAYHLATDRNDAAAANVPALVLTFALTATCAIALVLRAVSGTEGR